MRVDVRNLLAGVMFGGGFALFLAKPFLPKTMQIHVFPMMVLMLTAGFGGILLYNRVKFGVFFPGPPGGRRENENK